MPIPLVHHPDYVAPLPADHRFPMDKFRLTFAALQASGAALAVHEPEEISREAIVAVHCPDYADAIITAQLDEERTRRIGFAVTPRVARRSRLASAGTLLAARLALRHGYAANSAGGSHHAHYDYGAGFCVLNDAAIALTALLADGSITRALVIDLDVHQGDGTARLFAQDARVFTFSVHCEANYPVRKALSDLDIGLPLRTGDAVYLEAVRAQVPRLIAAHAPDLIVYVAGVDPHESDKLGRLALTDSGLEQRDELVADAARAAGIPLVSVMGGGYGDDVAAVANRHAATILTLAKRFGMG
jgi:acetoin utilization deacetylase AcuC-like enzyme